MSETRQKLFDRFHALKDNPQTIMPSLGNFVPEVKAELSGMGTQGAMELASALFGNGAFVSCGTGQYTPSVAQEDGKEATLAHNLEGIER